jgi:predicted nucleic acid-binding protein
LLSEPKIVIDTNILFSAILNPDSRIGKIIINSRRHFQFYSCDFLRTELFKHRDKLLKLTKLSEQELDELTLLLTRNVIFINEGLIPEKIISGTEKVLTIIDLNDTPFVALAKHLKGKLWTGDKQLIAGLEQGNFVETLTTKELSDLIDQLERR